MFGRENVYAMVNGFGVRVKDEREKDRNHLLEVTFEVPLSYDLADEIMPAMAKDLFQEVGGEQTPRPEIQEAVFNLTPETQLMTIRNHPDLDPDVRVAGVGLRKIKAKKTDAGTWILMFTGTWTLGDPKEAIAMIQRLKLGVYLTFQQQQPQLDMGPAVESDQQAQVDGQGNVTAITDGKKRRGRQKALPAADQDERPTDQGDTDRPVTH